MPSDNLARRDDLAGVALRVLRRVEEQTQHIAGESGAADRSCAEKVGFRHLGQAAQRVLNGRIDQGEQRRGRSRRNASAPFSTHGGELLGIEGLPT